MGQPVCNNVFKKWTINQSTTLSIGLPANKPRGKLGQQEKSLLTTRRKLFEFSNFSTFPLLSRW